MRGTEQEKATGLGLVLCKDFIEKNGGTISFESEVGKGSLFKVTIPKK
ncbi:MAG: ATP-binding protein [Ignavibacterium sp.]